MFHNRGLRRHTRIQLLWNFVTTSARTITLKYNTPRADINDDYRSSAYYYTTNNWSLFNESPLLSYYVD